MIRSFTLNSGKSFTIRCVTGTVIGSKTWSETEVKSRQNGGYVTNSGVLIGGGTSVSSTTVEKQELWIREDTGREECFRIQDGGLQTREGHRLSVALGAVAGKEPTAYLGIYQFNNNKLLDFTQTPRGDGILWASGLRKLWIDVLRWLFYCGCVAIVVGIVLIPIIAYFVHRSKKKELKDLSGRLSVIFRDVSAGELNKEENAA